MQIKKTDVTINVKDLDRSVAFYVSLGFELKGRWGNYYAQLTAPDISIGLHPTAVEHIKPDSGNISIGFVVEDFEQVQSDLSSSGIAFTERSEEGGSFIHFADPDGNLLYVIKPKWG